MAVRALLALAPGILALAAVPRAQAGDAKDAPGTVQAPPSGYEIPPAPPLAPDAALRAFVVEPGLRVELVAAEPQVIAPVGLQFDSDGRLWVIEMRGYMPDVDGTNEREATGAIAVLADEDADGTFETRTTFLDGLVLPRAVCVLRGAALVLAPPRLLLCPDRDGDLRADETIELFSGFGGLDSPEHAPNGLLWALDNRIYLAKHDACYVWDGTRLRREASPALGQWGIAQDDLGRLWYDDNSTHLRVDLLPRQLAAANVDLGRPPGLDHVPCRDQTVWPVRVTPGVNRGYQRNVLREGRLRTFTAACSPLVYRGTLLEAYRRNVFVCEPAGNLVRCAHIEEADGILQAAPVARGRELLASHDERFRPVALAEGPDGGLYVADMARGVIQHRLFVTTFLRRQILERGLEQPLDHGRIWRLVPERGREQVRMRLGSAGVEELVAALTHPAGAWRDLAQRELVLRRATEAAAGLDAVVRAGARPAALHALWTLHALGRLERGTLLRVVFGPDAVLRRVGYQVAADVLAERDDPLLAAALLRRASDEDDPAAARVLALVLGRIEAPDCCQLLVGLVARWPDDELLASAAVAGAAGREVALVAAAGAAGGAPSAGLVRLVSLCGTAVTRRAQPPELRSLLELARGVMQPACVEALLAGMLAGAPKSGREVRPGALGKDRELRTAASAMAETLPPSALPRWSLLAPVFAAPAAGSEPRALTAEEAALFDRGALLFAICAGCHGSKGEGTGEGPPFVQSEWLAGPPERLARIVLHGLEGPIEVDGRTWDRTMPKVALEPDDIAAVLTYARRTFASADPVAPALVRAVAEATAGRDRPYTAAELGGR